MIDVKPSRISLNEGCRPSRSTNSLGHTNPKRKRCRYRKGIKIRRIHAKLREHKHNLKKTNARFSTIKLLEGTESTDFTLNWTKISFIWWLLTHFWGGIVYCCPTLFLLHEAFSIVSISPELYIDTDFLIQLMLISLT